MGQLIPNEKYLKVWIKGAVGVACYQAIISKAAAYCKLYWGGMLDITAKLQASVQ